MSGLMYDEGSIMDFKPDRFDIEVYRNKEKPNVTRDRAFGWAVVVIHRDGWVVDTQVEPMVVCCGGMNPVLHHLNESHRLKDEELFEWRMA